jgi:hypothetical protein
MLQINKVQKQNRASYCIVKYTNKESLLYEQQMRFGFLKRRYFEPSAVQSNSLDLRVYLNRN